MSDDLIDLCDSSDGEDFGHPPPSASPQPPSSAPSNGASNNGVKVEASQVGAAASADWRRLSPKTLAAASSAAAAASREAFASNEPSAIYRAAAAAAGDVISGAPAINGPDADGAASNGTSAGGQEARKSLRDDVEAERADGGGNSNTNDDDGDAKRPVADADNGSVNESADADGSDSSAAPPVAADAAAADGFASDETPTIQDEPSTNVTELRARFDALPLHIRSRYSYGMSTQGLMLMGDFVAAEIMELALGDEEAVAAAAAAAATAGGGEAGEAGGDGDSVDRRPMEDDDSGVDGVPMEEKVANALTNNNNPNVNNNGEQDDDNDMDDDLRRVLELSRQTAREEEDQRAQYQRVLAAMSPPGNRKRGNAGDNGDSEEEPPLDLTPLQIRTRISRRVFDATMESIIKQMGGWDKIDNGRLVKAGNMRIQKSDMAAGGGMAQTRAQYGRYTCEGFWRLIDVLEGRVEADLKCSDDEDEGDGDFSDDDETKDGRGGGDDNSAKTQNRVKTNSASDSDDDEVDDDDRKLPAVPDAEDQDDMSTSTPPSHPSSRKRKRINFLPDARPIRAHVDIGHGIGIQVLQAGLGLGIASRGVEIMKGRQIMAESIQENLITCLRRDPPDMSRIGMLHKDFSRACILHDESKTFHDVYLRTFLLCRDLSEEEQKGLVIFVNNAREIFAARSCNTRGMSVPLDAHLAELFANMKVGGRMVTLEDISTHLHQNANWYRRDVFQSGSEAVSWGGNSVEVYVLTKLRDDWTCQVS